MRALVRTVGTVLGLSAVVGAIFTAMGIELFRELNAPASDIALFFGMAAAIIAAPSLAVLGVIAIWRLGRSSQVS